MTPHHLKYKNILTRFIEIVQIWWVYSKLAVDFLCENSKQLNKVKKNYRTFYKGATYVTHGVNVFVNEV